MQYMGLNDLREKFLSFMESKGHLRLPSFPLIPKDDNSLRNGADEKVLYPRGHPSA